MNVKEYTNEVISKNTKRKLNKIKYQSGPVSLYITPGEIDSEMLEKSDLRKLSIPNRYTEKAIKTEQGFILNFPNDIHVKKILKKDLAAIFGRPIYAVALHSDNFNRIVTFKDIPTCIRNEELEICLIKQGINFKGISRNDSKVEIEVCDATSFSTLQEGGIRFYDSNTVFPAKEETSTNNDDKPKEYEADNNVVQCYNCQAFWHTASTCRQLARCVRCGGQHQVVYCNRRKCNPTCCNCKGPHHAAYKMCPERIKQMRMVRVSFTYDNEQ